MAPTTSSSSALTLTYFDFAGPAEPVRMALAMTGQPWEDNRISFSDLPALKPGKLVCIALSLSCRENVLIYLLPLLASIIAHWSSLYVVCGLHWYLRYLVAFLVSCLSIIHYW